MTQIALPSLLSLTAARRDHPAISRWRLALEVAGLIYLMLMVCIGLAHGAGSLPLQLWDESRNANNALEMAYGHSWLVTTYNGAPDHWNTKPPVLIWAVAALIRTGIPPLVALRIPNIVATATIVALLWGVIRFQLKDRIGAFLAPALLLSSSLLLGIHGARTGDFDVIETLFVAAYVIGFWSATRAPGAGLGLWFPFAALTAAFMTKGVAGLLAVPGVLLALLVCGRLFPLLRTWRAWLYGLLSVAVCTLYFIRRDMSDHGFLQAMVANDISGRYTAVSAGHPGGWDYYLTRFPLGFKPAVILSPTVYFTLKGPPSDRRDLMTFCLISAASLLLVLSLAATKLPWYAIPVVPMGAVAVGLGLSDFITTMLASSGRRIAIAAAMMMFVGLVLPAAAAVGADTVLKHHHIDGGNQINYGQFLDAIPKNLRAGPIFVEDNGFAGPPDDHEYNPVIDFYRRLDARQLDLVRQTADTPVKSGQRLLSCDPDVLESWRRRGLTRTLFRDRGCDLVQAN